MNLTDNVLVLRYLFVLLYHHQIAHKRLLLREAIEVALVRVSPQRSKSIKKSSNKRER
jgi:hypothetical protein